MKLPTLKSNVGLKLLALALAIVVYYTLKTETSSYGNFPDNDRSLFQQSH